jgi:hypothetical protein
MKLFGQLINTAVNVAKLPVVAAVDAVAVFADASDGQVAPRTRALLEEIKREAQEER